MNPIYLRIEQTVGELNALYGRGTVTGVTFRKDGAHRFTRRIPTTQRTGFSETRRFRCAEATRGRTTVFALDHRKTIP